MTSTELFVAWQDIVGRGIYPVARLRTDERAGEPVFEFRYIRGALQAKTRGFTPFPSFPELDRVYVSRELFPFFTNRVMKPNRPDFAGYVAELGLSEGTTDPLAVLARSGGTRATDQVEVYAAPQGEPGRCKWHFLLRGVRHLPNSAEERIARLQPDERLFVMRDVQNEFNPGALLLRSADKIVLGYIPDLLVDDLSRLELTAANPLIKVVRVNLPPAPAQHRLLCEMTAQWPMGLRPFGSERYAPIEG